MNGENKTDFAPNLPARGALLWLPLAALALLSAGCGGSEADPIEVEAAPVSADDPGEAADTSSTVTVSAPETTVTDVPPVSTDPAELAQSMQLQLADFPTGYELSTVVGLDDACDGVPNVSVEFPPLAETASEFSGDHVHSASVAVYESPEAALEALDYAESGFVECNGALIVDSDGTESIFETVPFAAPAVAGTDRLAGYQIFISLETFSILFEANIGVIDSVLFMTTSTDATIVPDLTEALVARHNGVPAAAIMPVGAMEIMSGFSEAEYYSWPDGPAEVRSYELPEGGVSEWFTTTSDQRIDEVASTSCAALNGLEVGDDIDAMIVGVFTADELGQYDPETLGEVFGIGSNVYCPGLFAYLQEVASAEG